MLSRNCKDSISLGWVCRLEELASVAVRLSEKGIEFVGQFWCACAGRFSEHKSVYHCQSKEAHKAGTGLWVVRFRQYRLCLDARRSNHAPRHYLGCMELSRD